MSNAGTRAIIAALVALAVILCTKAPALAADAASASPQWIWGQAQGRRGARRAVAAPETCHFQRKFTVSDADRLESAELRIACDNRYVLRINDRLIGIGRDWQVIDRYDVSKVLRDGENTIAVVAVNDDDAAGLLVSLTARGAEGEWSLVSDASWQAAVQRAGTWDPSVGLAHDWRPAVERGPWPATAPWGDTPRLADTVRAARAAAAPVTDGDFELKDGDRVVLLGATMIEREPQLGYWEYRLTTQFPGRAITFRNLGWSGDTVFGIARARFGTVADGFEHLEVMVHGLEPTVILIAYGANESFDGPDGLERFSQGLDQLLATLSSTGARLVLLAPIQHENLGGDLPRPHQLNEYRRMYRDAIQRTAEREDLAFVDLFQPAEAVDSPAHHWTYNGIHLTPRGYYRTGELLAEQLGWSPSPWRLDVDVARRAYDAQGVRVESATIADGAVELLTVSRRLPYAIEQSPGQTSLAEVGGESGGVQRLRVRGLPPGTYRLSVDDVPVADASDSDLSAGLTLTQGPDFDQAHELRQLIVRKNELYFHRWRPQNETYLFLFRKHEQGNNAVEIPMFDPLIEETEARIRELSQPRQRSWTLRRAESS